MNPYTPVISSQQPLKAIDPTKTHQVADFEHDTPLTCCKVAPTGRFVFAGAEDLNDLFLGSPIIEVLRGPGMANMPARASDVAGRPPHDDEPP